MPSMSAGEYDAMPGDDITPNYVALYESGKLQQRIDQAVAGLESCRVCPWNCEVNRLENQTKVCRTGRYARVSSYFPHFGEEDCLRGWNGSGTIFFAWCNLRCVFCQNHEISQTEAGGEATPRQLADMMLELQKIGCHNINWVTPEHVVPQILESLPYAIEDGLRLPIVYNTSGYDSMESLHQMDGIVDIYMPDFKYWFEDASKRYVKTPDYPQAVQQAVREMHRQVGDLRWDDRGLATRGLLVRHLVMPDGVGDAREIMRFLVEEISPDTYVNVMAQYYPTAQVNEEKYPEINRRIRAEELAEVYAVAKEAGMHRFDERRDRHTVRLGIVP